MRPKLLLLPAILVALILFAFRYSDDKRPSPSFDVISFKNKNIVRCSPDWNQINAWIEENEIPPIPGAGNYKWKITTTSDSAQFYFNQGINMYYAFHIIEAMASFKKAARFDPSSAMLQWAQALAYGPNINDVGYAASPEALATSAKALELSAACTPKEKILIQAQVIRYSADSTESRKKLNQLYVDKMKEAYTKYPTDADIAALYADALMLQHPWDLWNINGTPKPWTPLIRDILEKLLIKTPNHPGANHYYIHVMEPSPYAAKALPSADRLGKLTPGLSHTVHMPSHIYLRTGQYDKGVTVNENAVNSYKNAIPLYSPVTGADFLYAIHNLHMQTNNAMLAGRSAYSVQSAEATMKSVPGDYLAAGGAMGNYIQYIHMTPVLVDIRFARWNELLASTQPAKEYVYARVLWLFGQGMAYAGKADIEKAKTTLKEMQELMKDSVLSVPFTPFSAAIEGAKVAEGLLAGSIALQQKQYEEAIAFFQKAVTTEDSMVYNEPRDWMLNPRHYLGNAYLEASQFDNAEKVFRKDLRYNNDNIWSLQGLYNALNGKRSAEASKVKLVLNKLQKSSDLEKPAPVLR